MLKNNKQLYSMSESELDPIQSAPRDLRIVYLQGFFEKSAKVSVRDRLVLLPVSSLYLLNVLHLLRELDVRDAHLRNKPILHRRRQRRGQGPPIQSEDQEQEV